MPYINRFKLAAHSPFFLSSRCRLFLNATFFGSCNIHILYTGCAKILKKIPSPNGSYAIYKSYIGWQPCGLTLIEIRDDFHQLLKFLQLKN